MWLKHQGMCQEKDGLSLWAKEVKGLNGIIYREEPSQVSELKSMMMTCSLERQLHLEEG